MSRLPVAAFVALVIATVGAFFVTQHLKVSTPLISGFPAARPAAINPVDGGTCPLKNHAGVRLPVSFKSTSTSFYLLHRSDDVDVWVVNYSNGEIVDTLATDRHMVVKHRSTFVWDGRTSSGAYAPDGVYEFRVSLVHQGRTFVLSNGATGSDVTVTVQRHAPALRVTRVSPPFFPQAGVAAVTVKYTGAGSVRPQVDIYRTDLPGGSVLVKQYAATTRRGLTTWNGTLTGGRPAPQGTYLVGLQMTDKTCNTARFPVSLPPAPGATAHAGVTIRYLAAEPPLTAVPAGGTATVAVDARQHRYTWTLTRAGKRHVLSFGASSSVALAVRLPAGGPGLYVLSLRWGPHRTAVPLIAAAAAGAPAARARVLVVLPALTWQGVNPVDDDGDGILNTLSTDQPIRLDRPLADGLPAGFADEAAFLAYLRGAGLTYDLTTDLGLIAGTGPGLAGRHGVVLAGDEEWLPASVGSALSTFVERGGHVLSLGIDSLLRTVTVSGQTALDPSGPQTTDALLARPGHVSFTHGALILVDRDGLHIFSGTSGALRGYRLAQTFDGVVAPARIVSAAGIANGQPSIIGYRLGAGAVVDVGLPGFGSTLARNVDAQELLGRVWRLLAS